jgi:hypothetical protein
MTATLLSLLPALLCLGLMFGAGAAIRLATRTPPSRLPFFARHAQSETSQRGTRPAA